MATSTQSNVNILVTPREPNSPIIKGFYYQTDPFVAEAPNVIIGTLAEYLAPNTIELYWLQPGGSTLLIFSGAIYNAINPPARLTGAVGGNAAPVNA